MNAYEAYIMYRAMKLHFTSPSYDFKKYKGQVSGKVSTFEKRNDRYMFDKLSKRKNPKQLLVAVLSANPKAWIGDVLNGEDIALELQKKHESLTYFFENEIEILGDNLKNELLVENGQHPSLLAKVMGECIEKDTLIILDDILGFMPYWRKEIEETIYFPDFDFRLSKYRIFLPNYDREKIVEKMKKRWKKQLTI
jgi:hypothetical protein